MTSTPAPSPTNPTAPAAGSTQGPLTDPAELFALLGRFFACFVLTVLMVGAFWKHAFWIGMGIGIFSLFYQRATIRMWRRMRDERMAAEAARAGATEGDALETTRQ